MKRLICPHTENCLMYANWVVGSKDKRIDIISKEPNKYYCLATSAYQDHPSEGGVVDSKFVKGRIDGGREAECFHIELLNLLSEINSKLGVESLL